MSLDPPLILVCVDKRAESHPAFALSQAFVVNILADEQEAMSRHFAVSGGDKFVDLPCRNGGTGAPILEGALAHVECRVVSTYDAGDLPSEVATSGARAYLNKEHLGAETLRRLWEGRHAREFVSA